MKNPKKILIIIQRSNGDVFLSLSLVNILYKNFNNPKIDLLVNDDTYSVAKIFSNINLIHKFSYKRKHNNRLNQEKKIFKKIYRKYDLSINLTASDRSVIYCLLSSKKSISAVENENNKSWWKKILLDNYYYFDGDKHVLLNNLESLNILNIKHDSRLDCPDILSDTFQKVKQKLSALNITKFIIYHPSAQYEYKVYPRHLRNVLLKLLNNLDIPILITGSKNSLDSNIKKEIPNLKNIINFIGETTLEEYFALSQLSLAYIGMDTLNMHIAASQNKRIFAIFGPTNLKMWSPWSNQLSISASEDMPIQTYGNNTIFQANMPCVACGKAGCNDDHGNSDCLDNINPNLIFKEIQNWYLNTYNQLGGIDLNDS